METTYLQALGSGGNNVDIKELKQEFFRTAKT
jgi:hypothetical protein